MTKKPKPPSEDGIQIAAVRRLRENPPVNALWTATLNGIRLTMNAAKKAKAMGLNRGTADLQFLKFDDGVTYYPECKRPGGRLSLEQIEFRNACQASGRDIWGVWTTVDELFDLLDRWGIRFAERAPIPSDPSKSPMENFLHDL